MNFSEWFKTMLAGLVGTAIGIVITFGAQNMVDKAQKRRTEKLSAMMVLSNINDYVMSLRNMVAFLDEMDSLFLYVSSLDSEDLLDADTVLLADFCNFFPSANYNVRDRTAERIFSSSFAVWENIASPDFISNVGRCFSLIDYMESMTLEMEKRKEDLFRKVYVAGWHKFDSEYDLVRALMESAEIRYFMEYYHNIYCPGMKLFLFMLEEQNEKNMEMLGISMEDLLDFVPRRTIKSYNTVDDELSQIGH